MTPTIAASLNLPRIETNSVNNAIDAAAGANHYRITGIEVGVKPGSPASGLASPGLEGAASGCEAAAGAGRELASPSA